MRILKPRYPRVESVMDSDYTDDLALLANTPAQTKNLLHSREKAAKCIGFGVNSEKTGHTFQSRWRHIIYLHASEIS